MEENDLLKLSPNAERMMNLSEGRMLLRKAQKILFRGATGVNLRNQHLLKEFKRKHNLNLHTKAEWTDEMVTDALAQSFNHEVCAEDRRLNLKVDDEKHQHKREAQIRAQSQKKIVCRIRQSGKQTQTGTQSLLNGFRYSFYENKADYTILFAIKKLRTALAIRSWLFWVDRLTRPP